MMYLVMYCLFPLTNDPNCRCITVLCIFTYKDMIVFTLCLSYTWQELMMCLCIVSFVHFDNNGDDISKHLSYI